MVRYSIEAGLLGPGVRVLLGGLFALALLAAGEWTRRKESISSIAATADRQHPGDPHRRRHGGGLCDRLCGLCAVRLPGARHRVHPARDRGDGHAGRGTAARAGAGRARHRRRLRHARSWSRPTSRTSGRSTSISRSSPRPRSAWRGCGCGAGLRSPPSCSRCCGRFPCLQCGPSMVAPHAFHVIAGFILAALLVVCGFMFGPPARGRRDRTDLVRLARGLSVRRDPDRAEQFSCRRRHGRVRPAGGRQLDRGLAHRCRGRRGRRRRGVWSSSCSPNGRSAPTPTCWCCPAARSRASGRAPPTDRSRCT